MNDIINGDIFVMIEIESFCSKSILPCYLLLFCYCIITRVSTTMLSNFYADLNAEEGAKSLMAMWLLILILLFFCFVMWSSDLKKKQDNFWRPGDGEGTSKQTSSSTNKVIRFFIKCTAQLFIWFADHCKNQVGGKSSMKKSSTKWLAIATRNSLASRRFDLLEVV